MSRARILADYVSSGDELAVTTATADAALPKAGGAMTGAITTNSTFDGVDIAARDAIHAPKASPTFTGVATAPSLVLTPGSAPGSPVEGQMYYNNTDDSVYVYNGTAWIQMNNLPASGGTITQYGSYRVHTFLSSGTFIAFGPITIDALIVGGGGAGSSDGSTTQGNGGGGAGGMYVIPGNAISASLYSIVIGAGGSNSANAGTSGANSSGFGFTSYGGGRGGWYNNAAGLGGTGFGSGGGGGYSAGAGGGANNFNDGTNYHYGYEGRGGSAQGGGGGGGAGGTGSGRNAGVGRNNLYRTGSNVTYAGGGAGGKDGYYGTSNGGGGSGNGGDGTDNTGGGGAQGVAGTGAGAGGSGIVIIRYVI